MSKKKIIYARSLLTPAQRKAADYLDMVLEMSASDYPEHEKWHKTLGNLLNRYDIVIHRDWPGFQLDITFVKRKPTK